MLGERAGGGARRNKLHVRDYRRCDFRRDPGFDAIDALTCGGGGGGRKEDRSRGLNEEGRERGGRGGGAGKRVEISPEDTLLGGQERLLANLFRPPFLIEGIKEGKKRGKENSGTPAGLILSRIARGRMDQLAGPG